MLTNLRLFYIFVSKFSGFDFLQTTSVNSSHSLGEDARRYTDDDDLDQCLYYLQTLSNILRWSSENMWAALAENTISTDPSDASLHRISELSQYYYL